MTNPMPTTSTLKDPRVYRRGAWARFVEGLRYGGGLGQWSWLVHRVTGLGILLFLVLHVLDTFFVVAWPALYDHTVGIYGGMVTGLPVTWKMNGYYWPLRWGFRFAELALIACVLFHAINGVRVVLLDFWPAACRYQRRIFWIVLAVFIAIMVPVTLVVVAALFSPPAHVVR
jgi:succinate dehydrogenase / fumarate reductase cytochrome b subunit